ncbi:MAG TPA: glucosamine-6-phosphate synthase, partial [Acidimicrobiales bacterium]
MCGIVAVISRPTGRETPAAEQVLGLLDAAVTAADPGAPAADGLTSGLTLVADRAAQADGLLRGVPGVLALADRPALTAAIEARLDQLDAYVVAEEARVDAEATGPDVERANAALVRVKDVLWALRRDRLRTAEAVSDLAGRDAPANALAGFLSVQLALSAIDRLEVRGRDSAGLHLFVWDHGLGLGDPEVTARLAGRGDDPLYPSGAVRLTNGALSFVYKAAAEIGELGDNTAALRAAIRSDGLLHVA